MHRGKMFAALTAALVLFGAACDDDDDNGTEPPPLERFTTQLRTSNEPSLPTPAPNATGNASVELAADEQSLTVTVTFQGLSGNANAAHIHGPFTPGGTTTSAGVILGFPNFPATQSGTYTQTFNAATASVGGGLTWAQLVDLIKQERTYVNVHTGGNPAGEIRGQLEAP